MVTGLDRLLLRLNHRCTISMPCRRGSHTPGAPVVQVVEITASYSFGPENCAWISLVNSVRSVQVLYTHRVRKQGRYGDFI